MKSIDNLLCSQDHLPRYECFVIEWIYDFKLNYNYIIGRPEPGFTETRFPVTEPR